jgi:glycosyltransferase involved in cell wall biosynthesis
LGDHTKVVFYIGDISEVDGVDNLIKAAPQVIDSIPDVRFLIVGRGTDRYMSWLTSLVMDLGVQSNFTFIEKIPHSDVGIFIRASQLCVAPFRITPTTDSSLPNKILEYLSESMPILASRGHGLEELLWDSIAYVEPDNVVALSEAIISILQGGDGGASKSTRRRVSENLSWTRIVDREELLLKATLDMSITDFRVFDYQPLGALAED